jgi:predicted ATPase
MRITTSLFNYKQILQLLAEKGREQFGKHFRLYNEDLPVLIPVIAWMLRDEEVAHEFNIDLQKGIFLGGPVGVGKTHIMRLMQLIVPTPLHYELQGCDKVSAAFTRKGPVILDKYVGDPEKKDSYNNRIWCFDDLGMEDPAHYYRITCEVMKKILLGRHELFMRYGTFTHFTSSLDPDAIERKYGKEVRSRMREMVNRITFDKNTKDKRGALTHISRP